MAALVRTLLHLLLPVLAPAQEPWDVLLAGGAVLDGSGAPPVRADVAIAGDRIAAVGELAGRPARLTVDARGLLVCPGFIDLHTHCDRRLADPEYRENRNYLAQGVTTVVTGNCGGGVLGVAEWFARLERQGVGTNVVHLVPHGTLRREAMGGGEPRAPSPAELAAMAARLESELAAGAAGLSTGLEYAPGSYSTTGELAALARAAGRHGGIYATHLRNEGHDLLGALEEALAVGRAGECPVHVSHLKAALPANWGKARLAAALIEWARARGQRVTADQYPYTAASTGLADFVVPPWARVGGREAFLGRLGDPETALRIEEEVAARIADRGGPERLLLVAVPGRPGWGGWDLGRVAQGLGLAPPAAVLALEREGAARAVSFCMAEEDVVDLMRREWVATGSDGGCVRPGPERPHPRSCGAFARKIGLYALEKKLIPLPQAVRSAAGLPAEILPWLRRGRLEPGWFADAVVLDPARYRDRATYEEPFLLAGGVVWLIVNGRVVIRQGEFTGELAGRPLRRGRGV